MLDQLDVRFAVRLAGLFPGGEHAAGLDDSAAHRARHRESGIEAGDGFVFLAYQAVVEQGLIRATPLGLEHEHDQPGGQPVQPVRRAELGQIQVSPQPHKRGLHDMPAARRSGHEMRFVHDQQVVIAVHEVQRERHRRLLRQVTVKPDERTGRERRIGPEWTVDPDDPAVAEHRVDSFRSEFRYPVDEVVPDGRPAAVDGQSQPDGVQAVPLGQRRCEFASHRPSSVTGAQSRSLKPSCEASNAKSGN